MVCIFASLAIFLIYSQHTYIQIHSISFHYQHHSLFLIRAHYLCNTVREPTMQWFLTFCCLKFILWINCSLITLTNVGSKKIEMRLQWPAFYSSFISVVILILIILFYFVCALYWLRIFIMSGNIFSTILLLLFLLKKKIFFIWVEFKLDNGWFRIFKQIPSFRRKKIKLLYYYFLQKWKQRKLYRLGNK